MIGVAICGGLVCAFAAGYCMGYLIHKHRPKRNAKGQYAK